MVAKRSKTGLEGQKGAGKDFTATCEEMGQESQATQPKSIPGKIALNMKNRITKGLEEITI